MQRAGYALALCGFAACLITGGASAQNIQNTDLRPLLDRLDRLERDMNLLQRQVYRGTGPGGAPVAVSPPDSASAVNYEVRISQIEDQMRSLTGQVEEVAYNVDQLKRHLETLASDIDQRLGALEHGGQTTAAAPARGAALPAAAGAPPCSSAPSRWSTSLASVSSRRFIWSRL